MDVQEKTLIQILRYSIPLPRFGLVADFDGTLSPITGHPDESQPTAGNRRLMADLFAVLPLVAVISGRSAADVSSRMGLPELIYIGNHGFERLSDGKFEVDPAVARYRPAVEAACRAVRGRLMAGEFIEDKIATASIHFRQARSADEAEARLHRLLGRIAEENGLVLTRGRMVFELRPPVDIDKGSALRSLVLAHGLEAVFYLGDDVTDVAALRMAKQLRAGGQCAAFGIGVESGETPAGVLENADYTVPGVGGVEEFLGLLLSERKASST